MNNKGFMMAEVVVVSAIILVFMVGMYASYNKIFSIYNQRINYYDVPTLYKLSYYRDNLIDNGWLNENLVSSAEPINISSGIDVGDRVYLIYNHKNNLNDTGDLLDTFSGYSINTTFKEYIDYLSTSVDLSKTNYFMIMESCENNIDCKYAYLEVYDGYE